jgi:hypothetical protein
MCTKRSCVDKHRIGGGIVVERRLQECLRGDVLVEVCLEIIIRSEILAISSFR